LPPRPPRYADGDPGLPAPLRAALAARGIERLYTHQAAALAAARAGAHLGIVTATASGKTLCYQLPVLERLLADPADRALLLFPTKALAQDQLRSLEGLLAALADERQTANGERSVKQQDGHGDAVRLSSSCVIGPAVIIAATLDGDTPSRARERVRAAAQIVLSNPDMLHRTVLPDHRRWAGWLARLRFVVVDEAHIYRGVFGTHVAVIMRRLQRLCAYYGGAPQFICSSATSANPEEHLAALVSAPVTVLADDGAPQGRRTFVFWNPPLIEDGRRRAADDSTPGYDEELSGRHGRRSPSALRPSSNDGGARRSTNVEAAQVFAALVRAGVKTLAFARLRRGASVLNYFHTDHLGSVSLVTNWPSGGALVSQQEFDPWGKVRAGGVGQTSRYGRRAASPQRPAAGRDGAAIVSSALRRLGVGAVPFTRYRYRGGWQPARPQPLQLRIEQSGPEHRPDGALRWWQHLEQPREPLPLHF
jgi:DEAD/DEAH box helicase domain-containing protein